MSMDENIESDQDPTDFLSSYDERLGELVVEAMADASIDDWVEARLMIEMNRQPFIENGIYDHMSFKGSIVHLRSDGYQDGGARLPREIHSVSAEFVYRFRELFGHEMKRYRITVADDGNFNSEFFYDLAPEGLWSWVWPDEDPEFDIPWRP